MKILNNLQVYNIDKMTNFDDDIENFVQKENECSDIKSQCLFKKT